MKVLCANIMYVVFPILLYFIAVAYNKTIDSKNNKLLLELSLLISLCFIMAFGETIYTYVPFYLLYIPLLIGYMYKRNSSCLLMSFMNIIYLTHYNDFNFLLVLSNYVICFLIYKFDKKYFLYTYSITNLIFMFFYVDLGIDYLVIIFLYIFTCDIVLTIVNYIDKIMKFYMTLKDIENNKQLQDSLFKISHEIKNPIAVCKGYLEIMDGSIEKYDKYIPIINQEINHSLSILKDFSSIGKLKIDLDIMDIGLLLDEVVDNYKIILDQKNIDLEYDYRFDELYIKGDYVRLKEVFINIIKNSIEAMDKLDKSKIKILVEQRNNKVIIKFIDTGCGIDNENINKVMTPFFTTKRNGTGLGTYLSREIIEGHNGSIEYLSKKGCGTEVLIKLDVVTI